MPRLFYVGRASICRSRYCGGVQDPNLRVVQEVEAEEPTAKSSPRRDVPPAYCCAILVDGQGRLVLEVRPESDADAPGRLTCFGGGREGDEEPLACLRRELLEEIGFVLGEARHVLTLQTPKGPAWFYRADGPEQGTVVACESGHGVRWVQRSELFEQRLADWHRAALVGWCAGQAEAWVGA